MKYMHFFQNKICTVNRTRKESYSIVVLYIISISKLDYNFQSLYPYALTLQTGNYCTKQTNTR